MDVPTYESYLLHWTSLSHAALRRLPCSGQRNPRSLRDGWSSHSVLTAPLTIGYLYDTELNFGEPDEQDQTCHMTNPGTATVISDALADYNKTYGSAFPSSPTATQEQMLLECIIYERTYAMANNCTWKTATDENATWEAARRLGNMNMSQPIASQYHATYGTGACWSGLPSNVNSQYTVYTVETNANNSSQAYAFQNSSQNYVACPTNPFTTCHR